MKKLIAIAAMAGLTACDGTGFALNLPSFGGSKGTSEITVTRDEVTLAGPHGFCVDPQSTATGSASAFVVFGNCAAISGKWTAPQPRHNAIVTTTVRLADPTLPRIGSASAQLARFFDSDDGQTLLSRSGDPAQVSVQESGATKDGVFFVYVTDTSDGAPEGTEDTYWRAYLDAKNSAVTVSVLSLESNPLSRAEGLAVLRNFSDTIQSQAAKADAPTGTAPAQRPVERPASDTSTEPQKTRKGILGRLFG